MPTLLDMALLSMDVYEKSAGGLNVDGRIGRATPRTLLDFP